MRIQSGFMTGNWDLLRKYKATPALYPHGVPLDHDYFADILKYYWWLANFPYAGLVDEEQYMWDSAFIPVYNPASEGILAYAGDKRFTTFDKSHGMGDPIYNEEEGHEGEIIGWTGAWIWWTNQIDLWKEEYHSNAGTEAALSPPTCYYNSEEERWESKIHPDTWIQDNPSGYAVDSVVSYFYAWKAKRQVVDLHTPPPDNPDDWEADINWMYQNTYWCMTDNPNIFHSIDKAIPRRRIHSLVIVREAEIVLQLKIDKHPSLFYPPQVDPKVQYYPLIYIGSQMEAFQFREKVAFEQFKITNPAGLGPVFDWIDRMGYRDRQSTHPTAPYEMLRRDGQGVLAQFNGDKGTDDCPGNQYINIGEEWYHNTVGVVNESNPYEWTANPKIEYDFENDSFPGLQNYAEMILCKNVFTYPADSTYLANLNPPDPDDITPPDVNSEYWGCNESGFELYLKKKGEHDWFFDMAHPYVPSSAIENAVAQSVAPYTSTVAVFLEGNPQPLIEGWKLEPLGTWRRTWMNTLGRLCPWIRSFEMGTPPNLHETWTPSFHILLGYDGETPIYYDYPCQPNISSYCVGSDYNSGINYDGDSKWFGARTDTMPLVTHFDNICKAITAVPLDAIAWVSGGTYLAGAFCSDDGSIWFAKQNITNETTAPHSNTIEWVEVTNYTFSIDGDVTDPEAESGEFLKEGWQIHLAPGTASAIDLCSAEYVLAIHYDEVSEKTIIMMSAEIPSPAGYIHWNRQVCQRHDGISATWEIDNDSGALTYTINYYPTVDLMLELMDVQEMVQYRTISTTWERKDFTLQVKGDVHGWDNKNIDMTIVKDFVIAKLTTLAAFDGNSIETNLDIDEYGEPEGWGSYDDGGWTVYNYYLAQGGWGQSYSFDFLLSPVLWAISGNEYESEYYQDFFTNVTVGIEAFALKAEWPEKLKELPKAISVKATIYKCHPYAFTWESMTRYNDIYYFIQKSKVANAEVLGRIYTEYVVPVLNPDDPIKTTIPLAANGMWFVSIPYRAKYWESYTIDGNADPQEKAVTGYGPIQLTIDIENLCAIIPINSDDAKESLWSRDMTGHIDCPPFDLDLRPPAPNPPQWQYKPQGKFVFIDSQTSSPKFEIYVTAEMSEAEDLEGSDVWYKMFCITNSAYDTSWTTGRVHEVKVGEINLLVENITGKDFQLSGYHSLAIDDMTGDYVAGDKVIFDTGRYKDIATVASYSGGTLTITFTGLNTSMGLPEELIFTSGVIYNASAVCRDADEWAELDAAALYFGFKTKDTAYPTPNESYYSSIEQPLPPDKYPGQVIQDAFDGEE
ncbi:MAG: hypothetical protein WC364_13870 [Eubacteriales bacterium]|jgi:hypothetical protein